MNKSFTAESATCAITICCRGFFLSPSDSPRCRAIAAEWGRTGERGPSVRGPSHGPPSISANAAVLIAACALITGCLSRPPLVKQHFAFAIPPLTSAKPPANAPVLAIRRLSVSSPFDGISLVYRTGQFSYETDPYAEFLAPPADVLRAPLRQYFQASGLFGDVTQQGSALRPNLLVEITVEQLYGDFRNRADPQAVLEVRLAFFDAPGGRPGKVILDKNYVRRAKLAARSAAALMASWNDALKQIMAEAVSDLERALLRSP